MRQVGNVDTPCCDIGCNKYICPLLPKSLKRAFTLVLRNITVYSLDIIAPGKETVRQLIDTNTGSAQFYIREDGSGNLQLNMEDTSGAVQLFLVATGDSYLKGGNLGIGSSTAPSAGDGKVLYFGDNAADPTMGTNTAGIYGKDVSGTVEMFAVDEAGNATQLSPHDPETGEWVFYSKNVRTGKVKRVNMERMIRDLEKITGHSYLEEWEE